MGTDPIAMRDNFDNQTLVTQAMLLAGRLNNPKPAGHQQSFVIQLSGEGNINTYI